jgi:hypothetical protein
MPIHGKISAKNFIGQIDLLISRIDDLKINDAFKMFFYVMLGISPSFLGSLFLPVLSPLFNAVSLMLLYVVTKSKQTLLINLSSMERYWYVCTTINIVLILWAFILVLIGQPLQIGRSVGPMTVMVIVSLWPAYIQSKKERRLPFCIIYGVAGSVVILQQIMITTNKILK